MAKYSVTHSCGHDEIHQIVGPARNRESRARWLAEQPCLNCVAAARKSQQDAENQRAQELAAADELPRLTGSEKQVAWAESIRRHYLDSFPDTAAEDCVRAINLRSLHEATVRALSDYIGLGGRLRPSPEQAQAIQDIMDHADEYLVGKALAITDAKWWIDNRSAPQAALLQANREGVNKVILAIIDGVDSRTVAVDDAAAEAIERETRLSETVRPETTSTTVTAEVVFGSGYAVDVVKILFPEKRPEFAEMVKSLGYCWDEYERLWSRTVPAYMDRSGELAHLVAGCLRAGIPVRCPDAFARELATTGLRPRQTRWITATDKGNLLLSWPTWPLKSSESESLYKASRRLPGARWIKRQGMAVSAKAFAAIRDFAEAHGFSISPAAEHLLGLAQEQYETIPTAVAAPAPPVETTPVKPDCFEPDPSLLDDDFEDDL